MLEKIGLPAKPAARGSSWVLDASHCQGCSSAFSLFNRKHYCRRCGGLFCGNCTQQRMVLRGQGEGLVRVCEPCKKLEDATRFESRYGQKNRTMKAGSKSSSTKERQLVGTDVTAQNSGSSDSIESDESDVQKLLDECTSTDRTVIEKKCSINMSMEPTKEETQESSLMPEVLRQQAHEERLKWIELRREGRSEEAMQAFKRGKELERRAEALDMSIKRNHRREASSSVRNREKQMESGGPDQSKRRHSSVTVTEGQQDEVTHRRSTKDMGEKDELMHDLKELGWNDADLQDADKKQRKNKSLESELLELTGVAGASKRPSAAADSGGYKNASSMQILAHKRRALALKREGKMTEAKEELKKAKIIEKQLEEQEMNDGDESDEELVLLIRNLENEGKMQGKGSTVKETTALDAVFNLENLPVIANEDDDDINVEVTDLDMNDPEMVTALRSLGWGEEVNALEKFSDLGNPDSSSVIRNQVMEGPSYFKQDGSVAIFNMVEKNKLQQGNRGGLDTLLDPNFNLNGNENAVDVTDEDMKDPYFLSALSAMGFMDEEPKKLLQPLRDAARPQSFKKANLQQEILSLKKEALALKRAGKVEEAKEELRHAKQLEKEMQDMQAHHIAEAGICVTSMVQKSSLLPERVEMPYDMHIDGFSAQPQEGDEIDVENVEVTEEDMDDPELAKVLRSLGWQDDSMNMEHNNISKPNISVHSTSIAQKTSLSTPSSLPSKRSELQKELLGLKRAALKLRREGRNEEAEEELQKAKILEKQMEMLETAKLAEGMGNQTGKQEGDELLNDLENSKRRHVSESLTADVENDSEEVTEDDMKDPDMIAALQNLGWSEDQDEIIRKHKGQDEPLTRKVADETAPVHFNDSHHANAAVHLSGLDNPIEGPATQFDEGKGVHGLYSSSSKEDVPLTQARKTEQGVQTSALITLNENNTGEVHGENGKTRMSTNQDPPLFDYEQGSAIVNMNPVLSAPAGLIDLLTGDVWRPKVTEPERGTLQDLLVPNVSATLQGVGYEAPVAKTSQELQEDHQRVVLSSEVGEAKPFAVSKLQKGEQQMVEDSHKVHAKETITEALQNPEGEVMSDTFPVKDLRQEILLHKRKALALKREGKQAEAKEELRQAKSVERRLALVMPQKEKPAEPMQSTSTVDVSGGQERIFLAGSPVQRTSASLEGRPLNAGVSSSESDAATAVFSTTTHTAGRNPVQKHVPAGKERMKLQQESLAHKRKALALRREGKVEEAEAEFEQAKALEKQMEEMDGKLATTPGFGNEEDDVGSVADVLDPQLLAALKGLGWKEAEIFDNNAPKHGQATKHSSAASQKSLGSGSSKVVGASNNKQKHHEERKHLEEQIKSEKMRALQLKRSGRQSEALDVLRGAKRLEKQLESMD